jgi:hypothetical protein
MKHNKIWTPLVLGTCLVAAVSCGSNDDDDSDSARQQERPPQQEEQQDQGNYTINFQTLNPGVGGNAATGTGTVRVTDQSFQIQLEMAGTPARITHLQHIHSAAACPTTAQDANGDGFVDVLEGIPSYGAILVPLDGNLNSQASGGVMNPRADRSGSYRYTRRATLTRMLADLQAEDTNPDDPIVKLPEGETLNLEGRTVIIHGVPATANLPETVGTIEGLAREVTLPIACGTIARTQDDGGGTTTGDTGTGTTSGETGTGTTTGETTTGGTTTGGSTTGR